MSDIEHGIISEIESAEGKPVVSGTTITTILDLDTLIVEAGVPEEFIKDINLETEANIKPLADRDRKYPGRVVHIAGMASSQSGETVVTVVLEVLDHDGFLMPNFNVDIEFSPSEVDESLPGESQD